MITSTIGKIFLEAYNKKYSTDYDAKTFFVKVYYPLFFDSNKYLQWVQNSPFVQMKKGQKVETLTQIERKEKLQDFITKVENCKVPDASIALGYPASEEKEFATTSGQVTNIQLKTTPDDIYLSWFGASLGIGMEGGYLLLSEKRVLLDLFEGFSFYRKYLNENDKLRGNQVSAWNGQWLAHRYDKVSYDEEQPLAGFDPFQTTSEGMGIATLSWTKILIKIAKAFTKTNLLGYFYGFNPKNKLPITMGFIPINLEGIKRLVDLYQKFFGMDNEDEKAEKLWGSEYGLKGSCKNGVIGVKSMQPEGLKPYMTASKDKEVKLPKYDDKHKISFHTYQIWLLAMLNNQELWDKSQEFAKALQTYVKKDKQNSTKRENLVKNILSAATKKSFIAALSEIAKDVEAFDKIEENAKTVNVMPTDNVPYYLTLIRFHYAGLENKNNQQGKNLFNQNV